jgi:hypothetical protein
MTEHIVILSNGIIKDSEGFGHSVKNIAATARAYKEERHGSVGWRNRAAFSTATCLFRFRVIPNIEVLTGMVIMHGKNRYKILSVEDIKGRGMYLECLCEDVIPVGKSGSADA